MSSYDVILTIRINTDGTLMITGTASQSVPPERMLRLPVFAYLPRLCNKLTLSVAMWKGGLDGYKIVLNGQRQWFTSHSLSCSDPAHYNASDLYTAERLETALVPTEARLACSLNGVVLSIPTCLKECCSVQIYLDACGRCNDRVEWAVCRLALAWPSVSFISSGKVTFKGGVITRHSTISASLLPLGM